jgi:hypothetical protein
MSEQLESLCPSNAADCSVSSEESEDVSLSGWQVEVCYDCEDGTWIIYYGERAPEDDNCDDENSFWYDKHGILEWLEGSPLPEDVREAVAEVILRQNVPSVAPAPELP